MLIERLILYLYITHVGSWNIGGLRGGSCERVNEQMNAPRFPELLGFARSCATDTTKAAGLVERGADPSFWDGLADKADPFIYLREGAAGSSVKNAVMRMHPEIHVEVPADVSFGNFAYQIPKRRNLFQLALSSNVMDVRERYMTRAFIIISSHFILWQRSFAIRAGLFSALVDLREDRHQPKTSRGL